ncbi:MAG: UvrB/UvrC motif-containing protein [Parachlamydiaceae bacterium]|nr:UvrB/UvrC motif-containing protein [Parachlamydiaceae bacterium]
MPENSSPLPPEEDENNERLPDRPLECTECRKQVMVRYTEIIGEQMTHTSMCGECPVLRNKLHGTPHLERESGQTEVSAGLACGNCGTSLKGIRMGTPLGCTVCYEVFDDILIPEMLAGGKVPQRMTTTKRTMPLHIGRSPGEVQEINPSMRLLALNEALNEMLKSEDYEQAAWLRDQIKALTDEQPNDTQKKEGKHEKQ